MRQLGAVVLLAVAAAAGHAQTPVDDSRPSTSRVEGVITALDHQNRALTIRDEDERERTLYWTSETRIVTRRGKSITMSDLEEGDEVEVRSLVKSGKHWAREIVIK